MRRKVTKIHIGGTPYFVKRVGEIRDLENVCKPGVKILGQFRSKTNSIVVLNRLGYQKHTTLVHELIHAIDREFDVGISEEYVDLLAREIVGSLSQLRLFK